MFRHMDELEIEIDRIKNIQMIHFYNLVAHGDELPAIIVYYGEKQQINLCRLDRHYEKLLEKAAGLYAASSDAIVVDEETEKILKAWLLEQRKTEAIYEGGSNEPFFYPESYMDYFVVPIMKYYISELYNIFSQKLVMNTYSGSWHGRGRMTGAIGEEQIYFPYVIRKVGECEFHVYIGNFLKSNTDMIMHILYSKEGFRVTVEADQIGLTGGSSFIINLNDNSVITKTSINIDGKTVYEEEQRIEALKEVSDIMGKLENEGIRPIFPKEGRIDFFEMPWGQLMGLEVRDENTENLKKKIVDIYYLFLTSERDHLRKISYRILTGLKSGVSISTYLQAAEIYVKKSKTNLIQVHYEPARIDSTGEYKQYLADKFYFYKGEMKAFI